MQPFVGCESEQSNDGDYRRVERLEVLLRSTHHGHVSAVNGVAGSSQDDDCRFAVGGKASKAEECRTQVRSNRFVLRYKEG